MNKISKLILGVLIVAGGTFFLVYFSQSKTAPSKFYVTPAFQTKHQEKKEATLYLFPKLAQTASGKKLSFQIKFKGKDLRLSAIAIRLTSKFNRSLSLKPQDAKMQVNPLLIQMGWLNPVNKIWVDQKNKMLIAELALVNPTISGFSAQDEEVLATIEFIAQTPAENPIFEFNRSQTKLITKQNEEISLNLEKGIYSIY